MKLYFKYLSILLKSQLQYKASFLMTAIGQFLVSFTTFLGVYFMYSRFHSVEGFTLAETMICFSVMLTAFSLAECFVRGFDVFPRLIKSGDLDRILVRPRSVVFQAITVLFPSCENMELMGITVNGGFAEYVKTKEFLAFPISDKVPLNHAAFAEPLSCAMNGFSRLNITPGDTCVVFGCGPIGLLFAQLARASGARVACVEVKENRMAKARELGFDVYAAGPDVKDKLIEKWGRRANFCIDAAGRQLITAIDYAEYRGTILCFAGPKTTEEGWSFSPIQNKELTVMGSFIINDSMARAITVLECGMLDLDPLVTHVLPLEELDKGIELMKSGEGMEIIMEINK